ncbi:MAG: ImmA/IrrE family metallo-endopeptidase [Hyphomicrobiales bacterium]
MVRAFSRIGCGRRRCARSAHNLPVEVRERGDHPAVARVGDALAVVFDGADAPVAREASRNHEDPITAVKAVDIDDFEGMLRARRKKPGWHILYSTQPRYRERFTLAHEFGHYMLHRRPLKAEHYRDGELPDGFDFECLPLQANHWKDAEKEREEEADTFASYLLMPIDDYRPHPGRRPGNEP